MKTVMGIDVGTQSVKVLCYDPYARQIEASASSELELRQDETGTAEQEVSWWLDALADCLSQISNDVKNSIVAISVSGQQHGFVALNKKGEVIAPVKLWCDTTTTEECEEIMSVVGGREACINKTGNAIATGYTAPKILWLKKHKPKAYAELDTILLPHDFINYHLSGKAVMEYGDASGTGLFNVATRQWHSEILQAIDSEKDLTSCLPPFEAPGVLSKEIAERYGLPAGIVIAPGGGDNMMGAIGTGNVTEGVVTMSLGSSGTVYAYSDKPIIDKQERLAGFCSSTGGWLPLMCSMNCTLSTELMRDLLATELNELEASIGSAPIGSQGVLVLPFFNGERSPNLPQAKASILGLDSVNSTPNNILRATMEAATYSLRLGVDALRDHGVNVSEIRLTGGGSNSPIWRQMVADICRVSVVNLQQNEGAAYGAALQAYSEFSGEPIENIVNEHVLLNEDSRCTPVEKNKNIYNGFYDNYKKSVQIIKNLY